MREIFILFFIKSFFSSQNVLFPVSRILVNLGRCDLEEMFTDVTSWFWLFLNIPFFIGKSFIFKDLIGYSGAVGSFDNRHSACELKHFNLPLRSHDHTNIFASCFFSRNSCFLFVLLLTVFLVIKHNTYNGTKNSNALSFFVSVTKIWIVTRLHSVLLLLGGDVELN